MATAVDSIRTPVVQIGLLPFTFRPAPPVDDPRSPDDLLEEIRRTIERQEACRGDTPTLLPAAAALPGSGDRKVLTVSGLAADQITRDGYFDLASFGDRKTARALHMRRELHQALDYGFALLDALDLPPLALDVIDDAIATLDALDAPDEDREDDDPAEGTSFERFGRGFVRCDADDAEEDDGCERGEEYGSEDGEDIGHHASQHTPVPFTLAERAEVAVMAARAAAMRRAVHV